MPQTSIEEILVDGQVQRATSTLVVSAGSRHLEVNYAAPSLRGGDWVRFRHRLAPLDQDWVGAGARRTASYPHLRPGQYVFQVTASDNTGVWNDHAAVVRILVKPHVWQTWWFRLLTVLALCAGTFAAYRQRIARFERRRLMQEAFMRQLITTQENERARLGRELHDDITQRLARLAIDVGRCELGNSEVSPAETAREVREGLVRLSEDIHALSYRLHPSVLEDLGLAEALKAECERFSRQESVRADVTLRELPAAVPPETALCLFRVAQEALRNVARHARARTAAVSLHGLEGGLQLAVHDDGCGFDPAAERNRPSLGLASMRERVQLLGGELDIDSAPGHGTTILAWVPLGKDKR
jgi:signal transduction histidine kinase